MKRIALIALLLANGCATGPKVETTKQWEGHFYKEDDAKAAVESMKLENKESVWILSNSTLKRLLTNIGEK